MRSRFIIAVGLVLFAAVMWQFVLRPAGQATAPRQTVTVKLGSVIASVTAPGQIVPQHQSSVYARNGGLVRELLTKPGARVITGQVLLRFDTAGLEAQIAAQRTQISAAQSNLFALANGPRSAERLIAQDAVRQATQGAKEALQTVARIETDFRLGAVAAQSVDAARASALRAEGTLETARLRLTQFTQVNANAQASARAQLEATRAQLRVLEEQRSATVIRAPMAGTLTDLAVTLGQAVAGGTVVAQVADLSSWIVQSRVAETDLPSLRIGMTVKVQVNALKDAEFEGKIVRVGQAQKYKEPLYYYQVDARLLESDPALTPSLTTSTTFITQQANHVPVIPLNALQTVKDKTVVELLSAGKTALTEVKTGLDDGTNVVILAGLKPGDLVVIPPPPGSGGDAPSAPGGLGGIVKF